MLNVGVGVVHTPFGIHREENRALPFARRVCRGVHDQVYFQGREMKEHKDA